MSYNESLMANSNYPPMSQSQWDNAPWNEKDVQERTFDIEVCVTLKKKDTITTNRYNPIYEEECGWCADTTDTDWKKEYNQSHLRIQDLLAELKGYVQDDMNNTPPKSTKYLYLKSLLEACDGWEIEDLQCEEI